MYEYDIGYIEQLTSFDTARRTELVRYYAKLPDAVRCESHRMQSDLMRQHKAKRQTGRSTEFFHAMFLLALSKMQWIENSQAVKSALPDEQSAKITRIQVARIKAEKKNKEAPTRQWITLRHEDIRQLRDEGLSWRQISDYYARFRRKRINHSYLRSCYLENEACD